MEKIYIAIWHNAYDLYAGTDYSIMSDYLREQVNAGNLTPEEAGTMAELIVKKYEKEEQGGNHGGIL